MKAQKALLFFIEFELVNPLIIKKTNRLTVKM